MKIINATSSAPVLDLDATGQPTDSSVDAESLRQAMALAWLAQSSPLAAPEDSLDRLQQTLGTIPKSSVPRRSLRWPLTALAGWGAAAALAILWLMRPQETPQQRASLSRSPERQVPEVVKSIGTPAPPSPVLTEATDGQAELTPIDDPAVLRREIAALRERLQHGQQSTPGAHQAVVFELAPPGTTAPKISRDHLLEMIANALEQDFARRSGSAVADEVVIERGWAKWNVNDVTADTVYRHRAFPVERAADLGLQPGPLGQFLDAGTGWVWTPDPLTGDYLGKIAPPDLDRTAFDNTSSKTQQNLVKEPPSLPRPARPAPPPEGYLVGAGDGQSILTLNNLPATADQTLAVVNSSGEVRSFSISPTNGTFSAMVPMLGSDIVGLSVTNFNSAGQANVILQGGSLSTGP
jgi:hypothetical protein